MSAVEGIVRDDIAFALRDRWPGDDIIAAAAVDGTVVVHMPHRPGAHFGFVEATVSRLCGRLLVVRSFAVRGGRMRVVLAPVSPAG